MADGADYLLTDRLDMDVFGVRRTRPIGTDLLVQIRAR
jgi:hypothetical protein